MGKIHELSGKVSQKICTGQVIITLNGACRELIDNALDAGATNIEVRTKENGTELLEIIDNGSGIAPDDFDKLCKPHCTSKLTEFDDFKSLYSYGFRGEALNALAALSDVQIITRDESSRCAWRLSFGRNGEILKREQCSRPQGTTVSISHLFKFLPVRRQELLRSARREFLRLVECVQAFALSRPECRFSCANIFNGKRAQMVSSPGGLSTKLSDVIASLFGAKLGKNGLLELEEEACPTEEIEQIYAIPARRDPTLRERIYSGMRLSGYVSSCETGQGRNSADRQFIFINRRHVDFPKLCRVANDVYSIYNRGQYCLLVLFVEVAPATVDVNICPDKRTVFLHHEKELFAKFRASLLTTFAKVQGTCPIQNGDQPRKKSISTLVHWHDQKIQLKQEEMQKEKGSDEEQEEEEEENVGLSESRINGSSLFPNAPETSPNYSAFKRGARKSAVNSTFLMDLEEDDGIIFEEMQEGNDLNNSQQDGSFAREKQEIGSEKDFNIGEEKRVERTENESSLLIIDDAQFNPDDSQNLRDSFVLAESTPNVRTTYPESAERRAIRKAHFDEITPIRSNKFTGFQTAAKLLSTNGGIGKANNELSNAQDPLPSVGFVSAASLFKNPKDNGNLSFDDDSLEKDAGRRRIIKNGGSKGTSSLSVIKTLEDFSFQSIRQSGMLTALGEKQQTNEPRFDPTEEQMNNNKSNVGNEEEKAEHHENEWPNNPSSPFGEVKTPTRNRNFKNVIASESFCNLTSPCCTSAFDVEGINHSDNSPCPSNSNSPLSSPSSSIFSDDIDQNKSASADSSIGRPHQTIHIDIQTLRRRFMALRRKRKSQTSKEENDENQKRRKTSESRPRIEEAELLNFDEQNAELKKREIERKLSLMLRKSDFGQMQLIGQFNNAFLLARLGPELFMIDQHAANEKFNFEWLQARATVRSQNLIEAQPLQLGSVNEALLKDNLELFRRNGFEFSFGNWLNNENEEEEQEEDEVIQMEHKAANHQQKSLLLTSTPNIKGYHFDKHDIDQLISMIAEMPGHLHRPNKIRSIFASNACRKSVMFGQALVEPKMQEIIQNMGEMEAPWNCPHGRPTIRHLCTIHIPPSSLEH